MENKILRLTTSSLFALQGAFAIFWSLYMYLEDNLRLTEAFVIGCILLLFALLFNFRKPIIKKTAYAVEGTEKVGTFQHFLSRGKNQELAKSKTVDLASFHFVQSISSRYRNLGRIRAQWQYSRYNKESPFSSNAVSA